MGKVLRFSIVIFCILLLSGCLNKTSLSEFKIVSPQNSTIPFEGTWEIDKCINSDFSSAQKNSGEDLIGKKAEFSKDGIKVGDEIWIKPSYKIKTVNVKDYFLYKYGVLMDLTQKDDMVQVITITSKDKFLYEFIKLDKNKAIFTIQDNIFSVKKISDRTESRFTKELLTENSKVSKEVVKGKEESQSSGVLLGIRYLKGKEAYGYKTLWVALKNMVIHPIMETDNIFLPRENGFWKLDPIRINDVNRTEDIITVYTPYQLLQKKWDPVKLDLKKWSDREGSINKKIMYVGNDYVSMEVSGNGKYINSDDIWKENRLEFKPIDNITGDKNIKISDIAGENGLNLMRDAKGNLIKSINGNGILETGNTMEDENFYLQRRIGHWFLKGRLNYEINGKESFSDYNINIIPPSSLVSFDILCVSWNVIKDKVPEAIDAYTSPNKNMAIVLSNTKLYVFAIKDGKLDDEPLAKVKLAEGDSVIMAEWATDSYVDKWEDHFMRNDIKRVAAN